MTTLHRLTISLPDTPAVRGLLAASNRSKAVLHAVEGRGHGLDLDLDPATLAALSTYGEPIAVARAAIRLALSQPLQLTTAVALAGHH